MRLCDAGQVAGCGGDGPYFLKRLRRSGRVTPQRRGLRGSEIRNWSSSNQQPMCEAGQ
jgi:hypothetical protein